MKKLVSKILFLVLLCITIQAYSQGELKRFNNGSSTAVEVKTGFGMPSEVIKQDLNEHWIYKRASVGTKETDTLIFTFDSEGVLIKHGIASKDVLDRISDKN